jgi:hypothetical protein
MNDMQPAVPSFTPDANSAYLELGKTFVYVKQLSEEMALRAVEANRLDDERIAAERKAEMFAAELERLRARVQELERAEMLRVEAADPGCGCACDHCED